MYNASNNKFLTDTHTLLWWWVSPNELSKTGVDILSNPTNEIWVSIINIWEMSIKYHKGRLGEAGDVLNNFDFLMQKSGFYTLQPTYQHALLAGTINNKHADPFDRMLVAQAQIENLTIITTDSKIHEFNVDWIW